jgi:hypothetical protein
MRQIQAVAPQAPQDIIAGNREISESQSPRDYYSVRRTKYVESA